MNKDFDKEKILNEYYINNAAKLHKIIDNMLTRFGGIYQKDIDDFYSIGNKVFVDVLKTYDGRCKFETYLQSCLLNKIKSEITRRNRQKRQGDNDLISLDTYVSDEDDSTLLNFIKSNYNLEDTVLSKDTKYSNKINKYLANLSELQRKILYELSEGYTLSDICDRLNISTKVYYDNLKDIRSYDKTKILVNNFEESNNIKSNKLKEENVMVNVTEVNIKETKDRNKRTSKTISAYLRDLRSGQLRDDHPLQRKSEQWAKQMRYDFIATILNNFPVPDIIIAEEVNDDGTYWIWLLDGLQRLSVIDSFIRDGFKCGKNTDRPIISYQVIIKDEAGNITVENRECDIRGKKFSNLPKELQDRFNDYSLSAVKYLACSQEDVEYHIRRYNNSKAMTAAQKGITRLGGEYAQVAKKLVQHTFLKDKGNYKVSEFKNGTMERVVLESVMACNFLDNWKKKQDDMCAYLKENVKVSHFDDFEEMLDRLDEIITNKEFASVFNSKETMLFMALFKKFTKSGLEDEEFARFLSAFNTNVKNKPIDGVTYEELSAKGDTKNKNNIVAKLDLLTSLMNEYLGIVEDNPEEVVINDESVAAYIEEFCEQDIISHNTDGQLEKNSVAIKSLMVLEDIEGSMQDYINNLNLNTIDIDDLFGDVIEYAKSLNDWAVNVDNNTKLFKVENIPILIKLVKYVYDIEPNEDLFVSWLELYISNYNNEVISFEILKDSLDRYIKHTEHKTETINESVSA